MTVWQKILMTVSAETSKSILNVVWNLKRHKLAKAVLKKNKAESLPLFYFRTYYKGSVALA